MIDVLVYGLAVAVGIGLFGALSATGLMAKTMHEHHAAPAPRAGRMLALNLNSINYDPSRNWVGQREEEAA